MKLNNKLVKDLTVALDDTAFSYVSLFIFINDEEAGSVTCREKENGLQITSVEITSISKEVFEKISELLIDKKKELIEWIEQVW